MIDGSQERRPGPCWKEREHIPAPKPLGINSSEAHEARRIAADIAKLPKLARNRSSVTPERSCTARVSARMTERQKVTKANLLAALETEFAKLLGRSVAGYMPSVRLNARAGEPNWNADIGGDIGISVLGAFLVALDHVKADYDLDDDDRERLIGGK